MKLTANVRQLQDMFSTVDAAGGQIKLISCRHTRVTFVLQDAVLICPYISITRDRGRTGRSLLSDSSPDPGGL